MSIANRAETRMGTHAVRGKELDMRDKRLRGVWRVMPAALAGWLVLLAGCSDGKEQAESVERSAPGGPEGDAGRREVVWYLKDVLGTMKRLDPDAVVRLNGAIAALERGDRIETPQLLTCILVPDEERSRLVLNVVGQGFVLEAFEVRTMAGGTVKLEEKYPVREQFEGWQEPVTGFFLFVTLRSSLGERKDEKAWSEYPAGTRQAMGDADYPPILLGPLEGTETWVRLHGAGGTTTEWVRVAVVKDRTESESASAPDDGPRSHWREFWDYRMRQRQAEKNGRPPE